jgi:hypothetical protein
MVSGASWGQFSLTKMGGELLNCRMTTAQRDECIESIVLVTLDNFSMAKLLLDFLIPHMTANRPPAATVTFDVPGQPVAIRGTNCGYFAQPVFRMAMLDCRRTLEFFGLTSDCKMNSLKPILRRRPDDLGIENFGLPRVTPAQFLNASSTVISGSLEPVLVEILEWSNKQLAHFTMKQPVLKYQSIRNMSAAMIEAYNRLLFDALGLPRPPINPRA